MASGWRLKRDEPPSWVLKPYEAGGKADPHVRTARHLRDRRSACREIADHVTSTTGNEIA